VNRKGYLQDPKPTSGDRLSNSSDWLLPTRSRWLWLAPLLYSPACWFSGIGGIGIGERIRSALLPSPAPSTLQSAKRPQKTKVLIRER